jgi:4-carboxymuconolactone decarboxylase
MNDDERRERGMKIRREVLGDAYVDRAQSTATPFTNDFQDLMTRYAWGEIWSRPGLDRRTRSCITVAMTVALNRPDELALHLRGALRNGVNVAELREVLLQTAVYCGIPAAHTAFKVAQEVLGSETD